MVEMATGRFPYNTWGTPFEQLKQVRKFPIYYLHSNFNWMFHFSVRRQQVVKDDPPRLEPGQFSPAFENFITACLQKKFMDRPNYEQLLQHAFLVEHMHKETDVAGFVEEILNLPDA